jgi:hypothetical protein
LSGVELKDRAVPRCLAGSRDPVSDSGALRL